MGESIKEKPAKEVEVSSSSLQLVIDDKFLKKRPLSASSLKAFRLSPKHYIEYLITPWVPKDEFTIGKACECILLEKEKFNDKFRVYNKFDKRSIKAKEQWEDMLIEAKEGKFEWITQEFYDLACKMAESALANPNCKQWIDDKRHVQRKVAWTHTNTGLPIIGYIDFDVEREERVTIVDIKTDYNGEPDKWMRHAADLDYELQVGSYLLGYRKNFYCFPDFRFMVIEKSSPYNAYMTRCPSQYMEDAKDEFENTLLAFRYCMDNQQFHMGYDFWLFDTMADFTMEKPRYKRSKFSK